MLGRQKALAERGAEDLQTERFDEVVVLLPRSEGTRPAFAAGSARPTPIGRPKPREGALSLTQLSPPRNTRVAR
jgi:hypothetical protein